MAITRFSLTPRVRSAGQVAQRAVQYLTREGPYTPAHSPAPVQPEVGYLVRETKATQARDDLVWQQVGNLPAWAHGSASRFFEAAAAYERVNGRWGMALQAALPRELSREQQSALTHDFLQAHFPDKPYLVVMHEPRTATGETQPHIHVLFSERRVDGIERDEQQFFKRANPEHPESGGAAKDRFWNERRCPGRIRQAWVDLTNYHLERAGHDVRVDARSLHARGIEREPERKAGWQREGGAHREQVHQARTQTDAREQQLAREHWEQRKQVLGITNVHDLSPEAMQEKSRTWARAGQPGRAIPPRSLEELQQQEAAQKRLVQQQEVYVNRLHAEIMQEEYRQRTGRPRSPQAEARIARVLAEGASQERTPERTPVHAPALGRTARAIREAVSLTETGQACRDLLKERGLLLARVTADDLQHLSRRPGHAAAALGGGREPWMMQSGGVHALSPEHRESAERSYTNWVEKSNKARFSFEGYVAYVQQKWVDNGQQPLQRAAGYREGDLVVVNRFGGVTRLTYENTGLTQAERDARFHDLDQSALPSVTAARDVMEHEQTRRREAWEHNRQQAGRERASERQVQEQALAGVEAGVSLVEDDTPGRGATFRIRDKERELGYSR